MKALLIFITLFINMIFGFVLYTLHHFSEFAHPFTTSQPCDQRQQVIFLPFHRWRNRGPKERRHHGLVASEIDIPLP